MTDRNIRMFDGIAVSQFKARLQGFDIEDDDADDFYDGAMVVLVGIGIVDGASFATLPNGDKRRDNKIVPRVMRVAKGDMRNELVRIFRLADDSQMEFPFEMEAPPDVDREDPDVDPETGEIEPALPPPVTLSAPPPPHVGGDDFFADEMPVGAIRSR